MSDFREGATANWQSWLGVECVVSSYKCLPIWTIYFFHWWGLLRRNVWIVIWICSTETPSCLCLTKLRTTWGHHRGHSLHMYPPRTVSSALHSWSRGHLSSFFDLWSWITQIPYAIETSYLLPPLIFICWTSSCEAKLLKPLQSGYSRMAQKRLCAYLIIQLSLEADKIATSAWYQAILLLILHTLVPSFSSLLQSKAKLLFLVKAENTGKEGVAILGT